MYNASAQINNTFRQLWPEYMVANIGKKRSTYEKHRMSTATKHDEDIQESNNTYMLGEHESISLPPIGCGHCETRK